MIIVIGDITVNLHNNVEGKPYVTLGREFQHTFTMTREEAMQVAQAILKTDER